MARGTLGGDKQTRGAAERGLLEVQPHAEPPAIGGQLAVLFSSVNGPCSSNGNAANEASLTLMAAAALVTTPSANLAENLTESLHRSVRS